VGLRAGLEAVVKRKIPSPYRDSNPPNMQRYTTELFSIRYRGRKLFFSLPLPDRL
jgi:hypothetical protein